MSTGMIIGGIVGAVIGFVVSGYNPYGAYIGFTIGAGAGALIDPIAADMPVPGQPELGNLNISTSDEGVPIKDVLGTTKIASGNIIWHCCQRVVEETEEADGGKGGGGTQTVHAGWEYFVSWALGLCMGPVDTLYTVYNGDDVVWSGELNCPATGGEETIVLEGMGSMTFYFGTNDQVANTTISSELADSTLNTPYRYLCWAFFDDCSTGVRECIPTMKFVLKKSPVFAFNANEVVGIYDYNPAHAIYYILNTLLEIPIAYLDGASSFSDQADTLLTEERGISVLFGSQISAMSYIESILGHIDGIIRWGNDGKFHPKLIRADEVVEDLPSFNENQMLDTLKMERRSWYDTLNEVKVQYTERIYQGCIDTFAMTYDSSNPETIDPDSTETITVSHECPPVTWGVIGVGFSFAETTTEGGSNTLIADATACGLATIIVTDSLGDMATGDIRSTAGGWVLKSTDVCELSGDAELESFECIQISGPPPLAGWTCYRDWTYTLISGKGKQVQKTRQFCREQDWDGNTADCDEIGYSLPNCIDSTHNPPEIVAKDFYTDYNLCSFSEGCDESCFPTQAVCVYELSYWEWEC